jgi:hypothetical protein
MTETGTPTASPSRKRFVIGALAALAIGGAALTIFVLPAEFGIDPTGAGKALGLTKLVEPENIYLQRGMKREGVLTLTPISPPRAGWNDDWQMELAPYEAVEFKYTLAKGQAMDFAWEAPAVLEYDMHAHPFEGGEELTESYSIGQAQRMQGRYVAAFTGLHGWYWQNRTMNPVTVTLRAAGPFTQSTVWEGGIPRKRPVGGEGSGT